MDFVHHSRMVFFAQVNDVHAARSCSNSGALRDRAAGQTFGLKQPENYSFQNLLFSLQVRSFLCLFTTVPSVLAKCVFLKLHCFVSATL